MIFDLIWIFGIGGFVFALLSLLDENGSCFDFWDFLTSIVMGFFTAFVTAIIVLIMAMIISVNSNTEYVQTYQTQIYANANKSFCIIENGSDKYKVYTDEANNNSLKVDKSKTELLDDGGASIEEYKRVYTNDAVKRFVGDSFLGNHTKFVIHVPKNSITTETMESR